MNATGTGRLFFSYGHDDNTPIVERIKIDLETAGYTVWIDTDQIKAGADWRRTITDGILDSHYVLAFLSRHSVRDPGVCRDELTIALSTGDTPLATILLEPEELAKTPAMISAVQWLDMSQWQAKIHDENSFEPWYQERLAELKAVLDSPALAHFTGEVEVVRSRLQPSEVASKHVGLVTSATLERPWVREIIEQWRSSSSPTLLITGSPGTGKSTLAATELMLSPYATCGVFCEWNKNSWSDGPTLVRNLAYNLATKLRDYRRLLIDTLGRQTTLRDLTTVELFDLLLTRPLNACIDGNRDVVFVIVDGLDEAAEGIDSFVDALASRHRHWPRWLKLLVTSRPTAGLTSKFYDVPTLDLDSDKRSLDDVHTFLGSTERFRGNADRHHRASLAAGRNFAFANLAASTQLELTIDPAAAGDGLAGLFRDGMTRAFGQYSPKETHWRPIVEVILADGSLRPETVRLAAKLTRVEFSDAIAGLEPFLVQPRDANSALNFFHKSFADWISNHDAAGKWSADVTEGAARLASLSRDVVQGAAEVLPSDVDQSRLYRQLASYHIRGEKAAVLAQFLRAPSAAWPLDPFWLLYSKIPPAHRDSELRSRLDELLNEGFESIGRGHLIAQPFVSAARFFHINSADREVQSLLQDHFAKSALSTYLQSSASDFRHLGENSAKLEIAVAHSSLRADLTIRDHMNINTVNTLDSIIVSCYFFDGRFDPATVQNFIDKESSIALGPPLPISSEAADKDIVKMQDIEAAQVEHNTWALAQLFRDWRALPYAVAQPFLECRADATRAGKIALERLPRRAAVKVRGEEFRIRWSTMHLESLTSPAPLWHPSGPEFVRGLGARSDYMDLYVFPCCGRQHANDAVTDLDLTPVLSSGCEVAPREVIEKYKNLQPDPSWPRL